jgi:hypothetical protein
MKKNNFAPKKGIKMKKLLIILLLFVIATLSYGQQVSTTASGDTLFFRFKSGGTYKTLKTVVGMYDLIETGGVDLQYPDKNTIQISEGQVIVLDSTTLEINGSNQLTVVGGTGTGGLFETDGNGDLMPNDAIVEDTYYELDGNGDIQPL